MPKLLAFAQEKKIDFTVVGPDNPLALGIVDLFQKHGLKIWGVNQKAAQFESSKVFSQKFMEKYGIPTAAAGTFDDLAAAKKFCASLGGKCVVKADGLALGKGVLICTNQAEAEKAVDEIMVGKAFGAAGANIVIQEFLEGMEISLHAICDGKTAKLFPTSQDHKRAFDGDLGLNTGGMGTYSPTPFLTDAQLAETANKILEPFMRGCAAEGINYRGMLYPGIMLTKTGPKVLEFNARFGDPETQVYLTRLENDLVELLDASAAGTFGETRIEMESVRQRLRRDGQRRLSGQLFQRQNHHRPRCGQCPAAHKSFPRRNSIERRANRHERRACSRRNRAGRRFEIRASRRLRRRGENPFRRCALPPRHCGQSHVGTGNCAQAA